VTYALIDPLARTGERGKAGYLALRRAERITDKLTASARDNGGRPRRRPQQHHR
jgi:hypothetical protein